jgi:phosphate transport system permease protein
MIVGMVKLAPALPVDGYAPFVHLERKFMHLGFHIYDVGFQSPNVEAAKPLVFATAFLLIVIVTLMNLSAITLRNKLRRRYGSSAV